MTRTRSILLLIALWSPAVLVGLALDARDETVEWWVWSAALVAYFAATVPLWWWITERRSGSHDPGTS